MNTMPFLTVFEYGKAFASGIIQANDKLSFLKIAYDE